MSTTELNSIGFICQCFQRPYATVIAVIKFLDLRPALVLDNVKYFTDTDVDVIIKWIRAKGPDPQSWRKDSVE